jgi:hypothetical protein
MSNLMNTRKRDTDNDNLSISSSQLDDLEASIRK